MNMRSNLAIVVCLCLVSALAFAQEVEFNYEGLVKIDGIPYNGPGYFKFSIVNKQGDVTLWSNDGTVAGGVEPATAVSVDVLDGVFNVIIGDASTANMGPLVASIFNAKEKVYLRVWFSDSLAGPYEQLSPDRAITNPALLGSQLFTELDLYVDPVLGDDKYPGNHPTHPKRTIQAAWNTLPTLINENATIHLADGVYRESVDMRGKSVIGDAIITIVGNSAAPGQVRVCGADIGSETTAVRQKGFEVIGQQGLLIRGIRFDYFTYDGVFLDRYSSVTVEDCEFAECYHALRAFNSYLEANSVEMWNSKFGFVAQRAAYAILYDANIHDMVYSGIDISVSANVQVQNSTVSHCSTGCLCALLSLCWFNPTNTFSYNTTAISVSGNAVVRYGLVNNTFSNNGQNLVTYMGGLNY